MGAAPILILYCTIVFNCHLYDQVLAVGVGGGGSGARYRGGGGSGQVESAVLTVSANTDLIIDLGPGGAGLEQSDDGQDTTLVTTDNTQLLTAAGGQAGQGVSGGEGYCGGGAQGGAGGSDGGAGEDNNNFVGGRGSGVNLDDLQLRHVELSSGAGGLGDVDIGGGGGAGVLINGEAGDHGQYQGQGCGAGGGGADDDNLGGQGGCLVMEILPLSASSTTTS